MILLFIFIHILTLQRICVNSIQTTDLLEERLEKLERKGMEQNAIIQKLMNDMEEHKLETTAQAEMIHDLSMKIERQTDQLILRDTAISKLENKLDRILKGQYSRDENFNNISGDEFDESFRNNEINLKEEKNNEDNYTTTNVEERSIRQRRLQLPVPTQLPKMNVAFRVKKFTNTSEAVQDFDQVFLNLGEGFKPSSGHFIAPTSGLYLFTLSVYARSGNDKQIDMYAAIRKNHIIIDKTSVNETNGFTQRRSVTVIVQLQTGEIVSVYAPIHSIGSFVSIKFSGVLIS